jgi:hypothetical protein
MLHQVSENCLLQLKLLAVIHNREALNTLLSRQTSDSDCLERVVTTSVEILVEY